MIELRNFISLNENELKELLKWRNSVGNFMKTQNISLKEHLNFVKSLKNDASRRYFVLLKDGAWIGVINFFNIDKKACEFGLYAKPNLRGVGQLLMNEVLNYAFDTLKVQILKACVFKTNERALTLYLKNDFKIINEDETMLYLCKRGGGGVTLVFKICAEAA
ncbi:UDP-4-amino-4,6-dideoxy-N-acetyl-beta-L-altrosamine N-acetyltransferase [Campylobacter upsaliensis]|uniref:UDP-4-amino-4, 6-dideoxy-N-acetyl-beta-L-altrosamine N-acetyltransferase n=1 Tax=Campylobacter upsaliensis TaxID=28080 RepID=UPI002B382A69|nr:UDP-4-amino-4,6-dideoxy-N-acetyl-beta-L-altrosamine N-acetyltransferase [Campylobacter upsaliensis]MEB2831018.1 UDP-4-amino-4,6-dideoxy-N-acetyl-beta-L-altrosamine N-acetyltransferase [Campylobacter upsaliensis]